MKIKLTFRTRSLAKATSSQIEIALNNFETSIGKTLPLDYRQHMMQYNGGIVEQDDIEHKNYTEDGGGISYFDSIGFGNYTIEEIYDVMANNNMLPSGYISIGITTGGGKIIMSLNDDETYGNTKESYPDGTIRPLSPSFTDLINDMVEEVG